MNSNVSNNRDCELQTKNSQTPTTANFKLQIHTRNLENKNKPHIETHTDPRTPDRRRFFPAGQSSRRAGALALARVQLVACMRAYRQRHARYCTVRTTTTTT